MRNFSAQASFDFAAQRRATIMAPKDQRQPVLKTVGTAAGNAVNAARHAAEPVHAGVAAEPKALALAPAALR